MNTDSTYGSIATDYSSASIFSHDTFGGRSLPAPDLSESETTNSTSDGAARKLGGSKVNDDPTRAKFGFRPSLKRGTIYPTRPASISRPFKCALCSKSFSTKNDLERHKKSIHKVTPKNISDKVYKCAAPGCTKSDKLWPRLDNFRQHCMRIHKDIDTDRLVQE